MENYKNILVTDGYAGYNELDKQLTHAECWAHARRYFYESVPLDNNKKMIAYENANSLQMQINCKME